MKIKKAIISGCFDAPLNFCPHRGHLHILEQMRLKVGLLGKVIVALNLDSYIREKKGREPLSNWMHRKNCLLNTGLVDDIWMSDGGLYNLIKMLDVDYIFVGSDYEIKDVVGCDLAEVIIVERLPNLSTSEIIVAQNLNK